MSTYEVSVQPMEPPCCNPQLVPQPKSKTNRPIRVRIHRGGTVAGGAPARAFPFECGDWVTVRGCVRRVRLTSPACGRSPRSKSAAGGGKLLPHEQCDSRRHPHPSPPASGRGSKSHPAPTFVLSRSEKLRAIEKPVRAIEHGEERRAVGRMRDMDVAARPPHEVTRASAPSASSSDPSSMKVCSSAVCSCSGTTAPGAILNRMVERPSSSWYRIFISIPSNSVGCQGIDDAATKVERSSGGLTGNGLFMASSPKKSTASAQDIS